MIIINGKIFRGNVTISNGQVISGDSCNNESKKYDEIKRESANGIKRLTINSNNVNVRISAGKTDDVTAHLHGTAIINGDITFSVTKKRDEIQISVMMNSSNNTNIVMSNSITIINSFSSIGNGLIMDVQIPDKVFERLSVESKNANIDLDSSVNATEINLESKNGEIDTSATFQVLKVYSQNGNVDIEVIARSNVDLDVYSKNGNINMRISNIASSNVSTSSQNGMVRRNLKLGGRYTVTGRVSSRNGNVRIQ